MSTRDAYVDKYKAQLDLVDAEIDRIEAKARIAKADAKIEYEKELADLRLKRDGAKAKLTEIKLASSEAWETLKQGAEDAWSAVSGAVKGAVDKFK